MNELIGTYMLSKDSDLRYMAVKSIYQEINQCIGEDTNIQLDIVELTNNIILPSLLTDCDDISNLVSTKLMKSLSNFDYSVCDYLFKILISHLNVAYKNKHLILIKSLQNLLQNNHVRLSDEDIKQFLQFIMNSEISLHLLARVLAKICENTQHIHEETLYNVYKFVSTNNIEGVIKFAMNNINSHKIKKLIILENPRLISEMSELNYKFKECWKEIIYWCLQELDTDTDLCFYDILANLSPYLLPPFKNSSFSETELIDLILNYCKKALQQKFSQPDIPEDIESDEFDISDEDMINDNYSENSFYESYIHEKLFKVIVLLCHLPYLNDSIISCIKELPSSILNDLKQPLLELNKNHEILTDFILDHFHEIDPSMFKHMSIIQLSVLGLNDSSSIDNELLTHINQFLISSTSVPLEYCEQWRNIRNDMIPYLTTTLHIINSIVSTNLYGIDELQWCIDMLIFISQNPGFNDDVVNLLSRLLKPNKRFIKVIQVGNMKQAQDDSTYSRRLVWNYLPSKLTGITYSTACNLLNASKYGISGTDMELISQSVFRILRFIVINYGKLLVVRDSLFIIDWISMIKNHEIKTDGMLSKQDGMMEKTTMILQERSHFFLQVTPLINLLNEYLG